MIDVQKHIDDRNISIDKVGVKNIRYPITVLDRNNGTQQTIASINMYVNLSHQYKGTHMSRFVELLSKYSNNINLYNIPNILKEMKQRLTAQNAYIELEFPFFLNKCAPISGAQALIEYSIAYRGRLNIQGIDLVVEVAVPVTTLCPCSKELSEYGGAHNQRGVVRLAVRFKNYIWIEDLVQLVENSASSEIYSILKREDEKEVTDKAYQNPMFVEDVVREIAVKLQKDSNIIWFAVDSENFESIHNHSAYAYIERDKRI